MIRKEEYLNSSKTVKQLILRIHFNLSYGPKSKFGSTNWFGEFSDNLDSPKPFIGSINGNKVELNGKGLIYWPKVNLIINEKENGSLIHIVYGNWWLYTITYLILLFFIFALSFRAYKQYGIEETYIMLGFLPFLIIIAIYGKWLQNNFKDFLIG